MDNGNGQWEISSLLFNLKIFLSIKITAILMFFNSGFERKRQQQAEAEVVPSSSLV